MKIIKPKTVIANINSGALKKGMSYPVINLNKNRITILIQGWKVSYLLSEFEPIT